MTILPSPPADWKRPSMSKGVKAVVFNRQKGKCAATDVKIGIGFAPCEYDHRPALWERLFDTEARAGKGDTIPPCNDPDHIQAIVADAHKQRTKIDSKRKAKGERIAGKKSDRFRGPARGVDVGAEPKLLKEMRTVPKRKWPQRKMQSRPFPTSGLRT